MSFNSVTLIGRCGKDADVRMTPQGKHVANVSVVAGSKDKEVWFNVVGWERMAEWVAKAQKGDQVFVTGPLSLKLYETKAGKTGAEITINVQSFRLFSKRTEVEEPRELELPPDDLPF